MLMILDIFLALFALTSVLLRGCLTEGLPPLQVSYFNRLRLLRTYILPVSPLGLFRHGLNKGDVRQKLDRETNCIIMRWLETSNPPVARAVAEVLIRSPQ